MNQPTINAFVPGTCGESIGLGKTCADLGIPIVLPTHFHVLDTFLLSQCVMQVTSNSGPTLTFCGPKAKIKTVALYMIL